MNRTGLTFIFFFLPLAAYSQWIPDISTESDWEYYYRNGYIDYESFQLINEIAEGAVITDTAEFITSTLGISPVDLVENYGTISHTSPMERKSETDRIWLFDSGRARFGSRITDGKSENYLLTSLRTPKYQFDFKLRDEQNKVIAERRSVELNGENYSVVLGNYMTDIGCGLNIGRFDYRPVSYEPHESDWKRFLFPDNSYYNGLKAIMGRNKTLIYSSKKYGNLNKQLFGSALSTRIRPVHVGIAAAVTRISNQSNKRYFGTGSLYIELPEKRSRAEIAYAESGAGACVQTTIGDLMLKGWYYDESYLNFQSSGFAHPDYQSYSYDVSEISFRQAQSGESGFYMRKDFELDNFEFDNAAEFWRNPRSDKINFNSLIQSRYYFPGDLLSYVRYYFYNRNDLFGSRMEFGGMISKSFILDSRLTLAFGKKSLEKENSRYYILLSLPFSNNVTLGGRGRLYFNGSYDYFLEEETLIMKELLLKVTYRWDDDLGEDLGSLYVILENRF